MKGCEQRKVNGLEHLRTFGSGGSSMIKDVIIHRIVVSQLLSASGTVPVLPEQRRVSARNAVLARVG